jgi:RimJ/RimL family protein N-acetyltransferase
MELNFKKLDLHSEKPILVDWLSSEEWPFHGNSRLSPEKVLGMIEVGIFDGSDHQSFWILDSNKNRVGMIRLFDLEDIDDGNPLFDIRLAKEFRGKGIGYQAVKWLTNYLFETWPKLMRIEGNTRADNTSMRRVFQKCYFVKEGHHRQAWTTANGQCFDAVHYAILREDWKKQSVTPVNWNDEAQN